MVKTLFYNKQENWLSDDRGTFEPQIRDFSHKSLYLPFYESEKSTGSGFQRMFTQWVGLLEDDKYNAAQYHGLDKQLS